MAPVQLSAVVPVLDEAENLAALHGDLCEALSSTGLSTEIVYVDDGSSDGSAEIIASFCAAQPGRVRLVVLRRTFGKSGALAAGFAEARGELVVTLDADGQDDPRAIPALLDKQRSDGLDLVCGWRKVRHDRIVKRATSRIYNRATQAMTGLALHDFNTGLKLLTREVVEELPLYGEFHRFVPVLAHDLGFRAGEVPVVHHPRRAGRSKYLSVLRFPKTMLDLLTVLFLTRFADRPLYLFGGVGMLLSVVGFGVLAYLSILWFAGQGIGERPLLQFGFLALLVGVQLFGTGFIGDVLRHSVARQQTPYRVRKVIAVEPRDAVGELAEPTDTVAGPAFAVAAEPAVEAPVAAVGLGTANGAANKIGADAPAEPERLPAEQPHG